MKELQSILEILKLLGEQDKENRDEIYKVGSNYLIRTVTMMYTGKLEHVGEKELVLTDAAWIADSGRFSKCLRKGVMEVENSEVEPFPDGEVVIGRGALVDACLINWSLPREIK